MEEAKQRNDEVGREGSTRGGVGDVESAGETTAAATLGGTNEHAKPVGADTLVKVADAADDAEGET